ncbi:MAG: SMC-Scp complex subunit ScpB [Patescibacteria group bacterium]
MTDLTGRIESLLFVASRPMSREEIGKNVGASSEAVAAAIDSLKEKYRSENSGICLIDNGNDLQMGTNPANREMVDNVITREINGDLTRAQLETLTVVAYCGPITRPELETIRGVNCAIILRNLQMRGLVDEEGADEGIVPYYRVSVSALRFLGIDSPADLPDYDELCDHPYLKQQLSTVHPNEVKL